MVKILIPRQEMDGLKTGFKTRVKFFEKKKHGLNYFIVLLIGTLVLSWTFWFIPLQSMGPSE